VTIWSELGIILCLIVFNGFLAMSELAVVSSRRATLQAMAAAHSNGARRALALIETSGRFLSTVQIGITLVGVLAGAFSGATLAIRFGDWLTATVPGSAPFAHEIALTVIVGAITYLTLIIGELVPKQIALANPERVAVWVARPMAWLAIMTAPFVWLLDATSTKILTLLRITSRETALTEDEIKAVLSESADAGVLKQQEQEIMRSVMRFADRKIRSIMTPRLYIDWLDINSSHDQIRERIRGTKHARYPVCRNSVNDVVGVVRAKDILDHLMAGEDLDLGALTQDVLVVPESAGALGVLEQIKEAPVHFAVVVDEYGTVEGIVTASDILSDLVGGLSEHGAAWEPQARQRDDGSWLIDGDMDLADVRDRIGYDRLGPQGRYTTLAGFMLAHFRTLPTAGEWFIRDGWHFEVVDMDGRRIDKVLAIPPSPHAPNPVEQRWHR